MFCHILISYKYIFPKRREDSNLCACKKNEWCLVSRSSEQQGLFCAGMQERARRKRTTGDNKIVNPDESWGENDVRVTAKTQ